MMIVGVVTDDDQMWTVVVGNDVVCEYAWKAVQLVAVVAFVLMLLKSTLLLPYLNNN